MYSPHLLSSHPPLFSYCPPHQLAAYPFASNLVFIYLRSCIVSYSITICSFWFVWNPKYLSISSILIDFSYRLPYLTFSQYSFSHFWPA
jgi:hypothetical protein